MANTLPTAFEAAFDQYNELEAHYPSENAYFETLVELANTGAELVRLALAHDDWCEESDLFWRKIDSVAPSGNDWAAGFSIEYPEFITPYRAEFIARCSVYNDGDQLAWARLRELLAKKRADMDPATWHVLNDACCRIINPA